MVARTHYSRMATADELLCMTYLKAQQKNRQPAGVDCAIEGTEGDIPSPEMAPKPAPECSEVQLPTGNEEQPPEGRPAPEEGEVATFSLPSPLKEAAPVPDAAPAPAAAPEPAPEPMPSPPQETNQQNDAVTAPKTGAAAQSWLRLRCFESCLAGPAALGATCGCLPPSATQAYVAKRRLAAA